MISSFESFKDHIVKMVLIRSTNYVNTDCDITALIDTVYIDLQNYILFDTFRQEHVIFPNEEIIKLDPSNSPEDNEYVVEIYTDVLDILDDKDVSILDKLHRVSDNVWRWNNYSDCSGCETCGFTSGDSIFFIRKSIRDIRYLNVDEYERILNAMLEGIMYYIEAAIPNQVDGQVGNFSYKRYYNAKKLLLDLQHQHEFYMTKEEKWI